MIMRVSQYFTENTLIFYTLINDESKQLGLKLCEELITANNLSVGRSVAETGRNRLWIKYQLVGF
jgi:hypothetical protein